jgi:hypothetical protein
MRDQFFKSHGIVDRSLKIPGSRGPASRNISLGGGLEVARAAKFQAGNLDSLADLLYKQVSTRPRSLKIPVMFLELAIPRPWPVKCISDPNKWEYLRGSGFQTADEDKDF